MPLCIHFENNVNRLVYYNIFFIIFIYVICIILKPTVLYVKDVFKNCFNN